MRSGGAALGVWLPIALADILSWVAFGATWGERKFRRGQILEAWCLPDLAAAVRTDEDAAEKAREEDGDDRLIEWIEQIDKDFGRKVS